MTIRNTTSGRHKANQWAYYIKGEYGAMIGNDEKKQRFENDPVFRAKVVMQAERHLREKHTTPDMPNGVYDVIYADPPWRYDFDVESRATENHYPTMLVKDICQLKGQDKVRIQDKFDTNAVLYLWTTSPKLNESFEVIRDWGFTYKTSMVWVKDKIGLGWYCRNQHELLLISEKGDMPLPDAAVRSASVLKFPRTTHSTKPLEMYALIEQWYPERKYLEVFATPNDVRPSYWGIFGNELYE